MNFAGNYSGFFYWLVQVYNTEKGGLLYGPCF